MFRLRIVTGLTAILAAFAFLALPAHATHDTAWKAPTEGKVVRGTLSGADCEATATSSKGIQKIRFYVDGVRISSDYSKPYNCAVDTTKLTEGRHVLKATAYSNGGWSNSASVNVTVQNAVQNASTRPNVGAQFHCMWGSYSNEQRLDVLDKMKAAGMEWVRIDFGWSSVEATNKGERAQWAIDRMNFCVDNARARGMKVLSTLWRTPGWANGGRSAYVPPTDPQDYGDFARWAAGYWKGRVAAWEVWNEPDPSQSFWEGTVGQYAGLLKASYDDFKAGDPDAPVVCCNPASTDDGYINSVYEHGAQGSFDVVAIHPYQQPSDLPPEEPDNGTKYLMSHTPAVHAVMQKYGDGDKKIWFTEFGWSSHPNSGDERNWEIGVTEQQQGDYFVRAIKHAQASFPYVTNMIWYGERNNGTSTSQYDNYGLLYRDLVPKPAYYAIRDYLLNGAGNVASVGGFSGRVDTRKPTVTRTGPATGARTVGARANVTATFSEAMRKSTLNRATVRLKRKGTRTPVSAQLSHPSASKVVLTPSRRLRPGATYVATVTPGAKDLAGNALDQGTRAAGNQAKSWSFTVRR